MAAVRFIDDPLGQMSPSSASMRNVILTAEIDPGEITHGQVDFDVVGHYARPDVSSSVSMTYNECGAYQSSTCCAKSRLHSGRGREE